MSFGKCILAVTPLRAEPSDKSEMVSQLLFGEGFEILEQKPKWAKIQLQWDNYIGWVDVASVIEVPFSEIDEEERNVVYCSDIINYVKSNRGMQPVLLGSTLSSLKKNFFRIGGTEFEFSGNSVMASTVLHSEENIELIALKYINAPYLWGGRSIFGIDCSGFTQMVFKMLGSRLLRDAYQQADQGVLVNFVEQARTGDLAFFQNEEGKIIHVGMILNNQQIIHASGRVRIDYLDHYGIFNKEKKSYSHQLRFIKRIL